MSGIRLALLLSLALCMQRFLTQQHSAFNVGSS